MFLKNPFNKSISIGFMSIAILGFSSVIHLIFKYYVHKSLLSDLVSIGLGLLFIFAAAMSTYGIKLALKFIKKDFWRALLSIAVNALVPIYFIGSIIYLVITSII